MPPLLVENQTLPEPVLHAGDHLDAAEFLRRWQRMPALRYAELIEGRVYLMASPVSKLHATPHGRLVQWLSAYALLTPELELLPEATTRLDHANVLQPDAQLNRPAHAGGRTSSDAEHYVVGSPDLVAEAAYSSESIDAHEKFDRYQAAGVREYVLWRVREDRIDWWANGALGFTAIQADEAGVLHSRVLPGLCMKPELLLEGNSAALFELIREACEGNHDHAPLCQRLTSTPR